MKNPFINILCDIKKITKIFSENVVILSRGKEESTDDCSNSVSYSSYFHVLILFYVSLSHP